MEESIQSLASASELPGQSTGPAYLVDSTSQGIFRVDENGKAYFKGSILSLATTFDEENAVQLFLNDDNEIVASILEDGKIRHAGQLIEWFGGPPPDVAESCP